MQPSDDLKPKGFSDKMLKMIEQEIKDVPDSHMGITKSLMQNIAADRKRIEKLEAIAGVECYCEYCNKIYHMDNCPDTKLGRVCPVHKTIVWRYRHWQVQKRLNKAEKELATQTATIERLRGALEPFAKFTETVLFKAKSKNRFVKAVLGCEDFKKARQALGEEEK